MQLRNVASAFSFFSALAIGLVAGFSMGECSYVAAVQAPADLSAAVSKSRPVKMETLLGTWTGKWDHAFVDCTVEITRVDGENFYGTLRERGAVVALEGTLDQKTRKITIHETKVLALGEFGIWSLGEDTGELSDGLWMSGTGTDKWGEYVWVLSHDK